MTKDWNISLPDEYICESNYYLINGKKYWRVTRVKSVINQPGLNAWRASVGAKAASRVMKIRDEYGTRFHKLADIIVHGKNLGGEYGKEMQLDLLSFKRFCKTCVIDVEATEQKMFSDLYHIAGTADIVMKYISNPEFLKRNVEPKFNETSRVIGDWKTSKTIYDEYWIQVGAYVALFEECTGIKLDGGIIAQFRDGKINVEEKTYDELKCYFEAMKLCIKLFIFTKEGC